MPTETLFPAPMNQKSTLKLLVADSNEASALSVKTRIENLGHSVELASTCQETLSKVEREFFDLTFLDVDLSGSDVFQLIPQIRKYLPEIDVVAMTNNTSRKLEQRARENRVIYFLLKPFSWSELRDIIEHVSRRKFLQKGL